jgi:hypothetical protein
MVCIYKIKNYGNKGKAKKRKRGIQVKKFMAVVLLLYLFTLAGCGVGAYCKIVKAKSN